MLNYNNLNDVEFEYLCQDIMSRKLGIELSRFAAGRDGGIDLIDDILSKKVIVQVKHYIKTDIRGLIASLRKEQKNVTTHKPKQYYVCCSKELTADNKLEIYNLFPRYMSSPDNVISLIEIDDFLARPENADILRKHFKLWIESTNILSEIFTKDICIDCESLLCDIEEEQKLFVYTSAFEQALLCLEKSNILMLIGNPGIGKTMTSKMLVLHYASLGYRVRYTTDGADLASLKKALSLSPDAKEVILLDDCFGQAYFSMKETQGNELLSLIKYIKLYPSKILIMNSRVTIYHEARERTPNLIKSFDHKEYKVFLLDISMISDVEKARILYNHLYFNDIPENYRSMIRKNRLYRRMINHANYNPRIVEYICSPSRIEAIIADDYPPFIMKCLDNPEQVWNNEYERRLKEPDRILLTTLFSLTNTTISLDVLQKCYNQRISATPGIDCSINHFDQSMARLSEALVKVIDKGNKKLVSVANPSINDFLRKRLENNDPERKAILKSSCSVLQLHRLLNKEEFEKAIKKILDSHDILTYVFENEKEKTSYIAYCCATYEILDIAYTPYIKDYLADMEAVRIFEKYIFSTDAILKRLCAGNLCDFYHLKPIFHNMDWLEEVLSEFSFDDLIPVINSISPHFDDEDRTAFIEIAKESIDEAINLYCGDVWAGEIDLDLDALASSCSGYSYDTWELESEIESEVEQIVLDEVNRGLSSLPRDIVFDKAYREQIEVTVFGAEDLARGYFTPDPDDDPSLKHIRLIPHDEIDFIFER